MIASAIIVPALTSAIASGITSLITAPRAPTANTAGAFKQTNEDSGSRPSGRMQNQKLTNLGQTLLQAPSTALGGSAMNTKQAKGFGIAVSGMAAQEAGQKIATRGGTLSKVLGAAMIVGGQVAQAYGADKFDNAGRR